MVSMGHYLMQALPSQACLRRSANQRHTHETGFLSATEPQRSLRRGRALRPPLATPEAPVLKGRGFRMLAPNGGRVSNRNSKKRLPVGHQEPRLHLPETTVESLPEDTCYLISTMLFVSTSPSASSL